jgi:hypothetical protein
MTIPYGGNKHSIISLFLVTETGLFYDNCDRELLLPNSSKRSFDDTGYDANKGNQSENTVFSTQLTQLGLGK